MVERELRAHLGAFKACYERELRRDPRLQGHLVLHFTIGPIGRVTAVAVDDDTVASPPAARCVTMLLARWRFPAPARGSVDVIAPVVFDQVR